MVIISFFNWIKLNNLNKIEISIFKDVKWKKTIKYLDYYHFNHEINFNSIKLQLNQSNLIGHLSSNNNKFINDQLDDISQVTSPIDVFLAPPLSPPPGRRRRIKVKGVAGRGGEVSP